MALNDNETVYKGPPRSAYGKIFRERGTWRVVISAALVFVVWNVYGYIHASMLNNKQWPPLKVDAAGLTVLGLQDHDRPGWAHKYEAIERSHAWIVRRPDQTDEDGAEPVNGKNDPSEADDPGSKDRGPSPGAGRGVNRGEIVSVEELMAKCPVVLTGRHFTSAWVEMRTDPFFNRKYYLVHVTLSDEGRSRYYQFSSKHDKERLAFVMGNFIVTCPTMSALDTSELEIQPIWVKEDADQLADFINKKK